ncbi:50S ribosomal protein L32 [Coxiella endosymbiont of Amblyomma sculptum]|uniref:50S ribosomal protein L32 n=1 Tax=Coxiella endosymbiont of Amblyomma sculptum TaxID=2487929 RepID=UPI00132F3026|nr:50S ribosomal protein L32 [Coxiella endosymbiont of Amblyomma sculptum]QHG92743.1 50S ribosomal protein L32 [Coxiella endosymbiont of Amblyomma sculptum]
MAVQKRRKTRSKRGMRRSHDILRASVLSKNSLTGEIHLRHHISPKGHYKNSKIIISKNEDKEKYQ